jgi:hypothetical protein
VEQQEFVEGWTTLQQRQVKARPESKPPHAFGSGLIRAEKKPLKNRGTLYTYAVAWAGANIVSDSSGTRP